MNMDEKNKSSQYIEWGLRILFTINIIQSGLNYDDGINYPLNVLFLILIGLWLYFFNFKILAYVPLFLALYINYLHLYSPHGCP
jgi:hypothetical protein